MKTREVYSERELTMREATLEMFKECDEFIKEGIKQMCDDLNPSDYTEALNGISKIMSIYEASKNYSLLLASKLDMIEDLDNKLDNIEYVLKQNMKK